MLHIIIFFYAFFISLFDDFEGKSFQLPTICKVDSDCRSDEHCDLLSNLCRCQEGTIDHYTKDSCLPLKNHLDSCEDDVQCHQEKKLGFICEDNKCVCPRNATPENGICPHYGALFFSEGPGILNENTFMYKSSYKEKVLLIGIASSAIILILVSTLLITRCLCKRKKISRVEPSSVSETSHMLLRSRENPFNKSDRSRPPSYSSLPPPSYDVTSKRFVPKMAAFMKRLSSLSEDNKDLKNEPTTSKSSQRNDHYSLSPSTSKVFQTMEKPTAPPTETEINESTIVQTKL